jgi:hypothetical protein
MHSVGFDVGSSLPAPLTPGIVRRIWLSGTPPAYSRLESGFKRAIGAIKCQGFRRCLWNAYASLRSKHGELFHRMLR